MVPILARASLVFLILTLVAGSALAGTVTGTVRAAEPRDIVVAAYDIAGTLRGSATADATGLYVLTLPAGSYRLLAYDNTGSYATMFDGNAESFETTPLTVVGAANDTVRRDFSLLLGGAVTGLVTSASGAPRPDAVVEAYNLSGTRRGFTSTGANGSYSLVLPPGEYKIVAYDANPNFAFSFYRDVRTFAAATPVRVNASQTTSGVTMRIELAARVTGTVIEGATGLPLAGIAVYAYSPSGELVEDTTTDAGGAFRFALPPGDYRFVAADPNRTFAAGFFGSARAFETSTIVSLATGAQQSNVQLALARGATIAGTVRDLGGIAAPGTTVAAYNLDGTLHASAAANPDGTYSLLVAPGAYKLVAFDPELRFATRFFTSARDFASATSIGIATGQALHGFDFALERGGRVTGTARESGTPRAGITVAAYDLTGALAASTRTAADGTYALVVAAGDYRLVAFDAALGFAPAYDREAGSFEATIPRTIAANAVVAVDFAIRRGQVVSGEVVDANGNPISGVDVFAIDGAGNRVAGAVSVEGAFRIAVPAASTLRFLAIDPAGRYARAEQSGTHFVLEPAPLRRRAARH